MITIRRARPGDAVAIGTVHVAAWRSAYPGILPQAYLANLSAPRQAGYYDAAIKGGVGVHVATVSGLDLGAIDRPPIVVGFATSGRARGANPSADGEIETLYVLDDWRERGLGRRLVRAAAEHLLEIGCAAAFLWVLRDNPSRWFYAGLGGKPAAEATIGVGGQAVVQTAYVWDPIDRLLAASAAAA